MIKDWLIGKSDIVITIVKFFAHWWFDPGSVLLFHKFHIVTDGIVSVAEIFSATIITTDHIRSVTIWFTRLTAYITASSHYSTESFQWCFHSGLKFFELIYFWKTSNNSYCWVKYSLYHFIKYFSKVNL